MLNKEKQIYPHKLFISPGSYALAALLSYTGMYFDSAPLALGGFVIGGVAGYYWDKHDNTRARRRLALEDQTSNSLPNTINSQPTEIITNLPTQIGQGETRPGVRK